MPARIQGNQRKGAGWPEFAGMELAAVAGVRTSAEWRCGVRVSKVKRWAASWGHQELGAVYGRAPFELRPRRRQDGRRPELG